ncbi:hypothetical protein M405DRAFT_806586 [Rhizopogon salebrosus TDB-379]|nr:hypothetical protein M405DRAFT_806586 [Rhizopogon salebrosus TDB-379]
MKDAERSKVASNVDEPKGNSTAWDATRVALAAKGQASPRMRTWHLLAIADRRSGTTSSRPTHSDSCFAWTRITLGASIKTTG